MSDGDQRESQADESSPATSPVRLPSEDRDRTRRPLFRRILRSFRRPPTPWPAAGPRDVKRVISTCRALLSERGEISGTRLATEVLSVYESLGPQGRELFFDLLLDEFSPNPLAIESAADAYCKLPSQSTLTRLQAAVEPPRQELFRRLNLAPGGIGAMIKLRGQLLNTLAVHPERSAIDADLAHLFRSWFNGGFLILERIDWRTSAVVLERLIQYEAVHQIQGWRDLRRRLEDDRRCYAFFHPALPDEPLIFIEVALTRGMSAKIQPLIDPESVVVDPGIANCATFYSITNCQEGLRGVSFGDLLIKQVVEDLRRRFPRVRIFATLSPVPGFRKWLSTISGLPAGGHPSPVLDAVLHRLQRGEPLDKAVPTELRPELSYLCAYYLMHAKHGRAPLDPVARFHLTNGARLERLNWLGDTSENGMQRSLGVMVNYVYRLADMERNHEAYARDYRVVASHELERLAKQSPLASLNGRDR